MNSNKFRTSTHDSSGLSRTTSQRAQGVPIGASMLRKLDDMENDPMASKPLNDTGHSRWMIPYADMLTLLIGFFLVLYSTTMGNQASMQKTMETVQSALRLKNEAVMESHAQLESLQEKLAAMAETPEIDSSEAVKLQDSLKQQGIEVHQQDRGIVITFRDSVLFEPGSAELTPTAKATLSQLVETLRADNHPIRVEGHTDTTPISTPQFPSNWELSTSRATNIVKYLVHDHHFDPSRLSAMGYGEFRPVANNSTIEGKQKNRRVDIVILSGEGAKQEPKQNPTQATVSVSSPQPLQGRVPRTHKQEQVRIHTPAGGITSDGETDET